MGYERDQRTRLAKMTPNITRSEDPAPRRPKGRLPGVSAINTIRCVIGINLETSGRNPPWKAARSRGYSSKAIRPIAHSMCMATMIKEGITGPLAFRHRRRGDWRGRRSVHPRGRKYRSILHGCDEIRLPIDQASLRRTSRLHGTNTTSKISTTFEATASNTSPRTRSSCVSGKSESLRSEFPSRADSSRLTAIGAAIGSSNNPPL